MVTHHQFGLSHVLVQQSQQPVAFDARNADDVGGEAGVDEEVLATRDGMNPHNRMDHRRHPSGVIEQLLHVLATQRSVEWLAPVGQRRDAVNRLQLLHCTLQRGSEALESGARVGPHRVAAVRRHCIAHQHGGGRRRRHEGDIRVPAGIATAQRAIDDKYLRMIGVTWHHRVGRRGLAERSSKLNLLGVSGVLAT